MIDYAELRKGVLTINERHAAWDANGASSEATRYILDKLNPNIIRADEADGWLKELAMELLVTPGPLKPQWYITGHNLASHYALSNDMWAYDFADIVRQLSKATDMAHDSAECLVMHLNAMSVEVSLELARITVGKLRPMNWVQQLNPNTWGVTPVLSVVLDNMQAWVASRESWTQLWLYDEQLERLLNSVTQQVKNNVKLGVYAAQDLLISGPYGRGRGDKMTDKFVIDNFHSLISDRVTDGGSWSLCGTSYDLGYDGAETDMMNHAQLAALQIALPDGAWKHTRIPLRSDKA